MLAFGLFEYSHLFLSLSSKYLIVCPSNYIWNMPEIIQKLGSDAGMNKKNLNFVQRLECVSLKLHL